MSELRQRMMEEMQLRRYAVATQEAYVHWVAELAKYYHKAPDQIEQEEVRRWFIHLTNELWRTLTLDRHHSATLSLPTLIGLDCNLIRIFNRVSTYRHPILSCRSPDERFGDDAPSHTRHLTWLLTSQKRGLFF